jgi:hypothetical protein
MQLRKEEVVKAVKSAAGLFFITGLDTQISMFCLAL